MKPQHLAVLCSALAAVSLQLGNLPDWHHALTPQVISAALVTLLTTIAGIQTDPIKRDDDPAPQVKA
jgi:hypothetical protein